LQVLQEQFSVTSNGPLTPAIKDLAVGALTLLPHTPVKALGINFFAHYRVATAQQYHKIGDVLAPKDIWKKLYPDPNQSAGMIDVTIAIEPAPRGEKPATKDKLNLTVQPSAKIPSGLYLAYNDHHELPPATSQTSSSVEWCAKLIDEQWERKWEDAKRVFEGVITYAIAS